MSTVPAPIFVAAMPEGISEAAIAPHTGAAEADPVPVWVKNCLAVVVFPARRVFPVLLRKRISPRVVKGDKASKAAVAVVCPVPPRAIAKVPD